MQPRVLDPVDENDAKKKQFFRNLLGVGIFAVAAYVTGSYYFSDKDTERPQTSAVHEQHRQQETEQDVESHDTDLESLLITMPSEPDVHETEDAFPLSYNLALLDNSIDFPMRLDRDLYDLVEQFRDIPDETQRARSIFEWELSNVIYGSSRRNGVGYRNSVETWNDREGVCGEETFLYVALARASNLTAKFAIVDVDYKGDKVSHGCAAVYIAGRQILVDPAYHSFDINHQQISVISDAEAQEKFRQWRTAQTCSGSD
ncbi:MAG: transglutaminase-like domain-containing protein [Nanoarchaeota archaeon]|nr:transglutaminase-like domain-containing protein [Nanoarchaeota archaeon]